MSALSRRRLLRLGIGAALGARVGPWRADARAQDPDAPVLVAIMLRGALDGLSVLVPHRDPAYARARPTLAIPPPAAPHGALPLTDELGMHPALRPLLPAYREGRLALVPGFGAPVDTRSHFEAQRLMELGQLHADRHGDGFLSRALSGVGARDGSSRSRRATHASAHLPVAVAAGSHLPLLLRGEAPVLALGQVIGAGDPTGRERASRVGVLSSLYPHGGDLVLDVGRASLDMLRALEPAFALPLRADAYPPGPLGRSLAEVARVIRARLGVPVFYAEVDGWDTHANQGASTGLLAYHLDRLAASLAAFEADLGETAPRVVVVCFTEFGRTVRENGSAGTDHGHGSVAMVLGARVAGGRVLGSFPSLAPGDLYEARDLPVTVDYRDVFGELLVRHLGLALPPGLFPGFAPAPERFPGLVRAR